jgi:ribosomal protein S18 acetylase RimI-like enzyme
VVSEGVRGAGVGRLLVERFLEHARLSGWAEVSVSTMADERGAAAFYRTMGFTDEALLLECHLPASGYPVVADQTTSTTSLLRTKLVCPRR